jgi:type IV pilus assembly protein PilC
MPVYRYQAVDRRGRNLSGLMPAHDESNLEQKLKALGLWLTEVTREQPGAPTDKFNPSDSHWSRIRGKRQRRDLIEFCTLMSYQVRVGIPLARALEASSEDCGDPAFRHVLTGLQNQIESGLHFYEALARYPRVFSAHFVSVIRAGELSSKLPETFEDLKKYLEWVDQVVADVRQATLYPAIVLTVISGFCIFLFTFIIPRFSELLSKLSVKQPLLTQIVFTAGDFARNTWWLWLGLFLMLVVGIPVGRRLSKSFTFHTDQLKLRLPVFGSLNLMLALSRFTHNLAILYRSGIPIIQALELCQRGLIGNAVIETAVGEVERDVKTGSTIGEAMHRHPVFPALLLRMISMGESTGHLDQALDNVAEYYNNVIPRRIKAVFGVLEPALMLFLIFMVGSVALAIYLPILSLMGSIHG